MKLIKLIAPFLALTLLFSATAHAEEFNKPAPDFTLKSMDGSNVKLSELRGEVIMLNFWASWCGPCREEMPILEEFYKKYKKLGFRILGINVEKDSSKAVGYLKDVPVTFPILFDQENKVSKMFDVDAMPSTVFIDRAGNVRFLHRGYKSGDEKHHKKLMKALMRE
ncbi:TlpA disulfide reductase family protein [Pleionea sp. CnH1-48]|uniref:TlpA disulfide reductase family protein n=1 Tax=Pleionea sp. CnH1-48 TaxID=2954494 RepID=UPI0020979181|nr:TlpA disulfide reductase family protein [Pleionea sp. CnH1-48]MCO7225547.1 TlpA family protein disulfide reductase [Pleionea sp. CnH1-48]